MWLLVGLGNPGTQYRHNRHNIGFMAVGEIIRRHGFSGLEKKFQGLVASGVLDGVKVLALMPQTYMNLSGQSVQAAAAFYKIPTKQIVVFHDELDLAPGKLRVKFAGGAAGHNGLRSIDEHLGQEYWRVRIGVGHPGDRDRVSGHVLSDFTGEDQEWLERLLSAVSDQASLLVANDMDGFMSKVAQTLQPPRITKEEKEKKEEKNGI